jgi:hypothetical protein
VVVQGVDAGKKAKTPRLGRPASAVSALTLGTEPSSEWSEVDEEDTEGAAEAAAAAAEKIGRDIRMSRPDTGYAHSHTGSVRPLAEGLTSLWGELPATGCGRRAASVISPILLCRCILFIHTLQQSVPQIVLNVTSFTFFLL